MVSAMGNTCTSLQNQLMVVQDDWQRVDSKSRCHDVFARCARREGKKTDKQGTARERFTALLLVKIATISLKSNYYRRGRLGDFYSHWRRNIAPFWREPNPVVMACFFLTIRLKTINTKMEGNVHFWQHGTWGCCLWK